MRNKDEWGNVLTENLSTLQDKPKLHLKATPRP